jgi:hypothetical protein
MREKVRKGGDDKTKVELSKHKLADSTFPLFVSPAARLSERWPSLTVANQRGEWGLKDILVVT